MHTRIGRWLVVMAVVAGSGSSAVLARTSSQPGAAERGAEVPGLGRPAATADPSNAALVHMRGWMMTPDDAWTTLGTLHATHQELKAGWTPPADLNSALTRVENAIQQTVRASRIERADWGIEWSDGQMAMLPHLGKLRQACRALELDARARLASADEADRREGAARLAALIRVARHTRDDGVRISCLVSGSIVARAGEVVSALADQKVLRREDAPALREALAGFDDKDPFGLLGTIRNEAWICTLSVTKTGADAGKKAAATLRETGVVPWQGEGYGAILTQIEGMDEAALRADVARQAAYFDEAEAILRAGGAGRLEKMRALDARVMRGEFGVTIRGTGASLLKAVESDEKNRAALKALAERVERLARGA